MVNQDHIESLGFGSYDSFLISISLGLFFMVISEIFKIAASLKRRKRINSLVLLVIINITKL
jgi:hypothetical protein